MSGIVTDENREPEDPLPKREGFWRKLASALDAFAAFPTKHAVSEGELRKAIDDIERCRRLIRHPQRSPASGSAVLGRAPALQAARIVKVGP